MGVQRLSLAGGVCFKGATVQPPRMELDGQGLPRPHSQPMEMEELQLNI